MSLDVLQKKRIAGAGLAGLVIFCAMLIVDYSLSGNFQGAVAYALISSVVSVVYYTANKAGR